MEVDLKQVALGIILLVVLYILYKIFSQKRPSLASARKLDGSRHDFTDLSNPSSPNYYLLMWVYVKNFDHTEDQILYTLKSAATGGTSILELKLGSNGNLMYDISGSSNNIVNSFPLQKWTCVVLSVDGNKTVDSYLDGKLVKSKKEKTALRTTSSDSCILEGSIDNGNDIRVGTFQRIPQSMDPGTAWKKYEDGNGGNFMTKMFSNYGVSLRLNKDDTAHSSLSFPRGGLSLGNMSFNSKQ
jgi:hypothetical protein